MRNFTLFINIIIIELFLHYTILVDELRNFRKWCFFKF